MPLPEDEYIQFKVTEEDIKNGRRNNPNVCPVALAIKRAIGEGWQVAVGWGYVNIYWGPIKEVTKNYSRREAVRYKHRYTAEIRNYDNGLGMDPFTGSIEHEREYPSLGRARK